MQLIRRLLGEKSKYTALQIGRWLWQAWRGNRVQAVLNASVGIFDVVVSLASVWAVQHAIDVAAGNLESSSGAISRVMNEERLSQLLSSLEDNLNGIDKFVRQLDKEAASAKLPESAAAFRAASGAVVESRQELGNTLLKLNQTIDSLRMLIDYLESDPSSLLNGKKRRAEK